MVSEWISSLQPNSIYPSEVPVPRFAWLSLDPGDNEPLRFWIHLLGALQVSLSDFGHSLEKMLSLSELPSFESILTSLINQLGNRSEKIVLVLDDYHLITEPSIHEGITFILEHLPPNVHLVITTRSDPPLPLNRLRIHNQLFEIRSEDLSFTFCELVQLLNDVMGLELSTTDLAVLEERTEGWAAGVQLAALLLLDERRRAKTDQIGTGLSSLVTRISGKHHLIADYLIDEVFIRQSIEVQRFLLETSILDELYAPLCDALFSLREDISASQKILDYLDHANLFLIPLDEEHTWFRYHNLFADALRHRLERFYPGKSQLLHQSASQWFEQNGNLDKAIAHAFAAQDYDRVAHLIEINAANITRLGRFATLNRWLEDIPKKVILSHKQLNVLSARAMVLSGKLNAAEQQLQAIEVSSDGEPTSLTPELRGQIAAVRSTAAILNSNIVTAKEQCQLAVELLPRSDPTRAVVLLSYGDAALMSGEISRGIQLLRQAVEQCRHYNDLSVLLTASAHLAEGLFMQGKLRDVEAVCTEAFSEVNNQLGAGNWPLPALALIYTLWGSLKREWNDLTSAEQALTRAVEIVEKSNYISALVNAFNGLAALRRSQGNIYQAIDLVERSIQTIHKEESTLFISVSLAQRADYWAQVGNYPSALQWAEERGLSADRTIDYLGDFELYSLTRLWIENDQADEADILASRLIAYAESNGRFGRKIEFLVLQALARQKAGRQVLALQSLETALEMGESEGYIRTFLDEGQPLYNMLLLISRKKTQAAAYARLLLSKIKIDTGKKQNGSQSSQIRRPIIEPLTKREIVVLRQLAFGDSNQEIAQKLVISVGTVKAHIYHITAKLGARSRIEAVTIAREIGLLS